MKNQIITIGIAILMAAGFSSCNKKDDLGTITTTRTTTGPASQGRYAVSKFEVNGVDHSDFYTGYAINFMQGGMLTAEGNGQKVTGTWTKKSSEADHLVLDFGSVDPFSLMNADWVVAQEDNTMIELKGSRGDDGTSVLVFKKM
jgi:hypothetical protein